MPHPILMVAMLVLVIVAIVFAFRSVRSGPPRPYTGGGTSQPSSDDTRRPRRREQDEYAE